MNVVKYYFKLVRLQILKAYLLILHYRANLNHLPLLKPHHHLKHLFNHINHLHLGHHIISLLHQVVLLVLHQNLLSQQTRYDSLNNFSCL